MNNDKLETAINEAHRFLKTAEKLRERRVVELEYKDRTGYYGLNVFTGCKESGALRRSSMDLSNSLADLRKSN